MYCSLLTLGTSMVLHGFFTTSQRHILAKRWILSALRQRPLVAETLETSPKIVPKGASSDHCGSVPPQVR